MGCFGSAVDTSSAARTSVVVGIVAVDTAVDVETIAAAHTVDVGTFVAGTVAVAAAQKAAGLGSKDWGPSRASERASTLLRSRGCYTGRRKAIHAAGTASRIER